MIPFIAFLILLAQSIKKMLCTDQLLSKSSCITSLNSSSMVSRLLAQRIDNVVVIGGLCIGFLGSLCLFDVGICTDYYTLILILINIYSCTFTNDVNYFSQENWSLGFWLLMNFWTLYFVGCVCHDFLSWSRTEI